MIGIYKITNKNNDKSYIGQSINIENRLSSHRKSKESSAIDLAIKNEGIENFTFEVLEECELKELNRRETYYINKYNSIKNGYNVQPGSLKDKIFPGCIVIYSTNEFDKIDRDEKDYLICNWKDCCIAAKELTISALKLYLYLIKNQNDYNVALNSENYCKTFNVVDRTYRNARNELISKGYLKIGENNKVFFDAAASFKETKENLQKRLQSIGDTLKVENQKLYLDLLLKVSDAKLPQIKNENVYKCKIKECISIGEDYLKDIAASEMSGLM